MVLEVTIVLSRVLHDILRVGSYNIFVSFSFILYIPWWLELALRDDFLTIFVTNV